MPPRYAISIIIPTYNRPQLLASCLAAIKEQDLPHDQFEVIVVDDGSEVDYSALIHAEYPFSITFLRESNLGAALARNAGALHASGEVLLFIDDDIQIVPQFLSSMMQIHKPSQKAVVIGVVQAVQSDGNNYFQDIYACETSTHKPPGTQMIQEMKFDECLAGWAGAMFSIRKEDFIEIGMFQDLAKDGRVAWGEVDLGCRAFRMGYRFFRNYHALGYHNDFSIHDYKTYANRWERTSADAVKLFQVYPETQTMLPMFADKFPINWKTDPTRLILRKILRQIASTRLILSLTEFIIAGLEKSFPRHRLLHPLYRWGIGAHIYRGFHHGLQGNRGSLSNLKTYP